MPGGNRRLYVLKQTYNFKLQVYLSRYDLFLPPGIKGLLILIFFFIILACYMKTIIKNFHNYYLWNKSLSFHSTKPHI